MTYRDNANMLQNFQITLAKGIANCTYYNAEIPLATFVKFRPDSRLLMQYQNTIRKYKTSGSHPSITSHIIFKF